MLVIKIELHPFGDATKASEIARMNLWNDGSSGIRGEGNYKAGAITQPSPWNLQRELVGGSVIGHERSLPVWTLVAKMLRSMGYDAPTTSNTRGNG